MSKSIRWRLPVSYAAIALLATLALGTMLLATLRGYYAQREKEYLAGNAEAISTAVVRVLAARLPDQVLQSQLDSLSFLSQVRVRVLDAGGREVASSSSPGALGVALAAVPVPGGLLVEGAGGGSMTYWSVISIGRAPGAGSRGPQSSPQVFFFGAVPVSGSPYGFQLDAAPAPGARRSQQSVRQPFYNTAGTLLGYVELSEGPAYGGEIVGRVALGWAIAGAVAVLLAGLAGWLVSRRMSAPLLALAGATEQMAAGDLAARAAARADAWSEVSRLAHSFNHMAGRVEETIVALRRFVADAAHELHTPLTALQTNLELAAGEESPAEMRRFVERAQAQAARLETLATALLDLSRLEAGGEMRGATPVSLAGLLRRAGEAYASQAEQAGLSFAVDVAPEAENAVVLGNEAQLRRAVDNLIDNASKFTPEGGAVRVALRRPAGGPDRVELAVEDTGIGIPAEDLPQVFSRFHRGRNTAGYPGNGLGLAIVRAVVEAHGGRVRAESTAAGTRVTLDLPAASAK